MSVRFEAVSSFTRMSLYGRRLPVTTVNSLQQSELAR
jgi:hypothetical protein